MSFSQTYFLKTTNFFTFFRLVLFCLIAIFTTSCKTIDEPVFGDTATDVDGNVYHTVTLGSQTWMIENLQTTRYNDGTTIPLVTDSAAWTNLMTPGYCWYNNSDSLPKVNKYGALYNWYSVNTSKLAPKGWHIPSDEEWTTLQYNVSKYNYLSGSLSKILAATTNWETTTSNLSIGSNLQKNNSSGFTALPSGFRANSTAYFSLIGSEGIWWTTNLNDNKTARCISLIYNLTTVERAYKPYQSGLSVRCIKDVN